MRSSLLFSFLPLLAFLSLIATALPIDQYDGNGQIHSASGRTISSSTQGRLLTRDFKAVSSERMSQRLGGCTPTDRPPTQADAWRRAEELDLQTQTFKYPLISRDVEASQHASLFARGGFFSKLTGGGGNRQPEGVKVSHLMATPFQFDSI